MEVSYNLRYQKQSFNSRVLIDKEGEVIIYAKGFRLKGKGAGDKGELINFSDLKEFYYRDEKIIFVTFAKEKYVLSEAGTLFEQLVRDLYKSRNNFLLDALFMKGGKLKAQYEGHFERLSKFQKPIAKGSARICLYERSLVIIPEDRDAFSLHFDFVSYHEFEDMDYTLKIAMDNGEVVFLSQLGNEYEIFEDKLNEILGGMYQELVNGAMREAFCEFHAGTLLKLAYQMKGGKAASMKEMMKMDKDLAGRVREFVMEDELFAEKAEVLNAMVPEDMLYFGVRADSSVLGGFVKWMMWVMPEKNVVAFSILPRFEKEKDLHPVYFYKIIMEKGTPAEKYVDKIMEINQALLVLNFVKDPLYKDKRELKHSPYQYAIRKLPFLRILRKSYCGRVAFREADKWKESVTKIIANCGMGR